MFILCLLCMMLIFLHFDYSDASSLVIVIPLQKLRLAYQ